MCDLNLSRRDVEPLGDGWVDGGGRPARVSRKAKIGGVVAADESGRVLDGDVAAA